MALEVYFKENIKSSITGLSVALLKSRAKDGYINDLYVCGVLDMALTFCLCYSVEWETVKGEILTALKDEFHLTKAQTCGIIGVENEVL